ncbi:MAG: hypothetical protein LBB77_11805 [Treponema sp.]|jgi:hypothetical protein|nr:hypothetical protein [Treponema sp.]
MKAKCRFFGALVRGLIGGAVLALLVGACSHEAPAPSAEATGKLTVSLGLEGAAAQASVSQARTIHPAESAFGHYTLSFAKTSGGADHDLVTVSNGSAELELVVGTYTITAAAKASEGATKIAVGKKAGVVISAGNNAPISITLGPDIDAVGTGTFNYTITYPEDVTSATITIAPRGESGTPEDLPLRGTPGSRSLAPGYYDVTTLLIKDADTAGDSEVIHIYSGLTTETWTKTYTGDHFAAGGMPPGEGDLVVGVDFGYGEIPITNYASPNGIPLQKGGQSVELTVAGYDNVTWFIDGVQVRINPAFTLDPESYTVKTHSLTVTGIKDDKPYARNIAFTVAEAGT